MSVECSKAFAIQSCSDFDAWDHLVSNNRLAQCHRLHYLQMAMEKAAKAHLHAGGASVKKKHSYIQKVIPTIVRDGLSKTPGAKAGWQMDVIRKLARKIELLHPQVDDEGSVRSNCEYPWTDAKKQWVAPANYEFGLNVHGEKAFLTMMREVRTRVFELSNAQ